MRDDIQMMVNGAPLAVPFDARRSLLDVLRDVAGLNGPKYGCGMGQCGACAVLVDGALARACVMRAAQAEGRNVVTLEGLAGPEGLHPVQAAFGAAQAAQCGYCLNGMVMTVLALLRSDPAAGEAEIRAGLRHNLCRCGTHQEIVAAALDAAARLRDGGARHG